MRQEQGIVDYVERGTMRAYRDAHEPGPDEYGDRNLNYRACAVVPASEAARIMALAVTNGYNNFTADLLNKFDPDTPIRLAREGSPCVYVENWTGPIPTREALQADEHDEWGLGVTRIWWD